MNTVPKQTTDRLSTSVPAANADELHAEPQAHTTTQTGGWDAYEVWNRFIREARQRRQDAG